MEGNNLINENIIKELKEKNQVNDIINVLKSDFDTIIKDYKSNIIDPLILKNISKTLKDLKKKKNSSFNIENIVINEQYNIFRKVILEEKNIRVNYIKNFKIFNRNFSNIFYKSIFK